MSYRRWGKPVTTAVLKSSARVRKRGNSEPAEKKKATGPSFSPSERLRFMQRSSRRGRFAKNLYAVTAATLGILLWGSALLDWAGYTRFVLSLRWF